MELLIGFAVATVLVLGWFAGNLFCCVMLTLAIGWLPLIVAAGVLMGSKVDQPTLQLAVGAAVLLPIIWAPRWYRKRFIGVPAGSAERLDRPLELL
jgi:hypothetical protein